MDELKKNNILHIVLENGSKIEGIVEDYQKDRVMVLIGDKYLEQAKTIKELDDLKVTAKTQFGLKKMISGVIYTLDKTNHIVIENAPSVPVTQKRADVRAVDDFEFQITADDKQYSAICLNISAGGIAFSVKDAEFEKDKKIDIIFAQEIFSKEIKCSAKIIKKNDGYFSAIYTKINEHDKNKIVKRIYRLLSAK